MIALDKGLYKYKLCLLNIEEHALLFVTASNRQRGVIVTDFLEDWTRQSDAHARLAAQERLIAEVTEAIWGAMAEAGINQTGLASRIGATKGHISQVLNGSRNMTLRTLADICFALELKPIFDVKARQQRVQHGSIVQKQEASKSFQ